MSDRPARTDDQFLLSYNPTDLRIASEFLSNWLPFLSRGLCHRCTQTLSLRVRSLDPAPSPPGNSYDVEPLNPGEDLNVSTLDNNVEFNECDSVGNCDAHSLGSWKDSADTNYMGNANLLGSWTEGYNGCSEPVVKASTSGSVSSGAFMDSPRVKMSWADMAQEDELEAVEDSEITRQLGDGNCASKEVTAADKVSPKTELSREEREYIRFSNVSRKKDFICLERFKGKIVNILDGLELHTGVFSAAEQKRIVDFVHVLQEQGKKGELKERTYTAPQKWIRGKGRVTIQFGCCYIYATDKYGNPPGILQNEMVDPLPQLFKVIIRRLVRWHVLPPSCVPDSCIVNIYDEGDCIPPHIDNHDFVRPFCTVSFLSECNIVFGTNLKAVGPGEFSGFIAIPLPVGSVLVLNGNCADVAKHCVPAVPTKRISITFRRMDESKRPTGYVPEPDLQGLVPYASGKSKRLNVSKQKHAVNRQAARRDDNAGKTRVGSAERGLEPRYSGQARQGPAHRRKVRINLDA